MDTQHEKLQIFEDDKNKKKNVIIKERNKEKECLLLKIKSKYILNNIKNYIDNLNILKLVAHSKKLLNKFNYELINYQYYYFLRIQMSPIYYYFSLGNNFEEDLKINNIELKTYENLFRIIGK